MNKYSEKSVAFERARVTCHTSCLLAERLTRRRQLKMTNRLTRRLRDSHSVDIVSSVTVTIEWQKATIRHVVRTCIHTVIDSNGMLWPQCLRWTHTIVNRQHRRTSTRPTAKTAGPVRAVISPDRWHRVTVEDPLGLTAVIESMPMGHVIHCQLTRSLSLGGQIKRSAIRRMFVWSAYIHCCLWCREQTTLTPTINRSGPAILHKFTARTDGGRKFPLTAPRLSDSTQYIRQMSLRETPQPVLVAPPGDHWNIKSGLSELYCEYRLQAYPVLS